VTRQTLAGQRIERVSGNDQAAAAGAELAQPLVARLLDAAGAPVAGRTVVFRVTRGGGTLAGAPNGGRQLAVATDAAGRASARFLLGGRAGAGNQQVTATAVGFAGAAEFRSSATTGAPDKILAIAGDPQRGVAGEALPHPLTALVVDARGNALAGVAVTFSVARGGGHLGGQANRTVTTDEDGRAAAALTLGPGEGVNNNQVTATFAGNANLPATFTATGLRPGRAEDTRIVGVVLDNATVAIPGATVRVRDTGLLTTTDAQGRFAIAGAPVGTIHLIIDGATANRPGERFPMLEFEVVTIAGRDNTVGIPILMPAVDTAGGKTCGGPQECVLEMAGVPGTALTIAPNSVVFKDGSRVGQVQFTQVHADKVPMAPPNGAIFFPAWTIQPAGAHFDPPARVTIPNSAGLAPGEQMEIFQFDHDVEEFVSVGPGTVSADGSTITSDPGFGITKAGWGGGAPPPPPTGPVTGNGGGGQPPPPPPPNPCSTQAPSASGLLGDVILVDLSGQGMTDLRFLQLSNSSGAVAQIDDYDNVLRSTFRFYFVPSVAANSSIQLRGKCTASGNDVDFNVAIAVTDGWSRSNGANPVTFGNPSTKLDIYRQQQRLRYFKIPGQNGSVLTVDGDAGPNTRWAIGLFNAITINDRDSIVPSSTFETQARPFVNASNPPRWGELTSSTIAKRWATEWTLTILRDARTQVPAGSVVVNRLSPENGDDPAADHSDGMDIDVEVPGSTDAFDTATCSGAFFRSRLNDGICYVESTNGTIIVETAAGQYEARSPMAKDFNWNTALRSTSALASETILTAIESLIVSPSDYKIDEVRRNLEAFSGRTIQDGAAVEFIYFNDPRTWDIAGVTFKISSNGLGHNGHFHVHVAPPSQASP
jgi:hypothetical protein